MKKFTFLALLNTFTLFTFISCSKEAVDSEVSVEVPTSCSEPSFFAVSAFINDNTVQINWDKTSGDAWEIQYGPEGFTIGSGSIVAFTSSSNSIGGLKASVNYQFYIRTKCGASKFSSWLGPVVPGGELTACALPFDITAIRSLTDPSKVVVSWLTNGDENSWQLQYGPAGFMLGSGTILSSLTNTKVVSNLSENTTYEFYIRSNCSENLNSSWVGPIAVASEQCSPPTNLTVVRDNSNNRTATVTWNPVGNESSWEIQYGNIGFAPGTGTSVISGETTISISGLDLTSYDFYLRAICSTTQNSTWIGPINLAEVSGIDNMAAIMTANIAGTPFGNMVPYNYEQTGSDVRVLNNNAPISDPRYLWIQGVTSDNLVSSSEISIYLPSSLWEIGGYPLLPFDNVSGANFCQVKLITNPASLLSIVNRISEGRLEITEFNRETRVVKGTFSFSYDKFIEGELAGRFRVTEGTFKYALDDPYFD